MSTPTPSPAPFPSPVQSPSSGSSKRAKSLSSAVAELRNIVTSLGSTFYARDISRLFSASHLDGVTHHGARDLYASCGYPRDITPEMYIAKYRRNGVARRAIRIMPSLTWGSGVEVIDDPSPETITPFERDVNYLKEQHQLDSRLFRSDIAMRLGEFGVLLIGAPGEDPSTEMPMMRGPQDIKYFATYTQSRVRVKKTVVDIKSPRYGQADLYEIIPSKEHPELAGDTLIPQQDIQVHWSRVIHLSEGMIESEIYGEPALAPIFNLLIALEYITHAGSEASWQRAHPGYSVNFKDTRADQSDPYLEDGEIEAIEEEVKDLANGLRRFMVMVNGEVNQIGGAGGSTIHDFAANAEAILDQISVSLDFPKRRFMGSERGHLASTQDEDATDDLIGQRRREFAAPTYHRLLDRLVQYGAVTKPSNPLYQIDFSEADEMNQKEIPAAILSIARANQYLRLARMPPAMTTDEMRDTYLHREALTNEQLAQVGFGATNPDEPNINDLDSPGGEGDPLDTRIAVNSRNIARDLSLGEFIFSLSTEGRIKARKTYLLHRAMRERATNAGATSRKVRAVLMRAPVLSPERMSKIEQLRSPVPMRAS